MHFCDENTAESLLRPQNGGLRSGLKGNLRPLTLDTSNRMDTAMSAKRTGTRLVRLAFISHLKTDTPRLVPTVFRIELFQGRCYRTIS
jgi:hypothetical protein